MRSDAFAIKEIIILSYKIDTLGFDIRYKINQKSPLTFDNFFVGFGKTNEILMSKFRFNCLIMGNVDTIWVLIVPTIPGLNYL